MSDSLGTWRLKIGSTNRKDFLNHTTSLLLKNTWKRIGYFYKLWITFLNFLIYLQSLLGVQWKIYTNSAGGAYSQQLEKQRKLMNTFDLFGAIN